MDEAESTTPNPEEEQKRKRQEAEVWVFINRRRIESARKKTLDKKELDDKEQVVIEQWNNVKEVIGVKNAVLIYSGKKEIRLESQKEAIAWLDEYRSDVKHIRYTLKQPPSRYYRGERLTPAQQSTLSVWDEQIKPILGGFSNAVQALEGK